MEQRKAVEILAKLRKETKNNGRVTLCVKRDLAEDETEDGYRHGKSWQEYFFQHGKFWHQYSSRFNKKIRERDNLEEGNQTIEISPERLLRDAYFKTYDMGFYGGNTSYVNDLQDVGTDEWIKKAEAIVKYLREKSGEAKK